MDKKIVAGNAGVFRIVSVIFGLCSGGTSTSAENTSIEICLPTKDNTVSAEIKLQMWKRAAVAVGND